MSFCFMVLGCRTATNWSAAWRMVRRSAMLPSMQAHPIAMTLDQYVTVVNTEKYAKKDA
jgi:hypothetical protein